MWIAFTDFADQFQSAHFGHHHIRKDEIGFELLEKPQALFAVYGHTHLVAFHDKNIAEGFLQPKFILNNQDAFFTVLRFFEALSEQVEKLILVNFSKQGTDLIQTLLQVLGFFNVIGIFIGMVDLAQQMIAGLHIGQGRIRSQFGIDFTGFFQQAQGNQLFFQFDDLLQWVSS